MKIWLFCVFASYISVPPVAVWKLNLWEMSINYSGKDITSKTLRLDFLKQMESGSLQADRYVTFTIQDINYLLNVTEMLKTMSEKITEPADLKDFMTCRYTSYKKFSESMGEPSIQQTPAMKKYLSYYRSLMTEDPIYFEKVTKLRK